MQSIGRITPFHFKFGLALIPAMLLNFYLGAQSVGINNPTPNANAILDITSTSKGLLIPRMTLAQRLAIPVSPLDLAQKGLIVYQKDGVTGFYFYEGISGWTYLSTDKTSWSLTGNSGTDPSIGFIGTTDSKDLVFRTNNSERVRILSTGNVGIGLATPAVPLDVNGNVNISAGSEILLNYQRILGAHGSSNLFVGTNAGGYLNSGNSNSFVGYQSGLSNTSGSGNSFSGTNSGGANTIGSNNSFFGFQSGLNNTNGSGNSFIGKDAGKLNSNGINNSFLGFQPGLNNTSGSTNVFIGFQSGWTNTTGSSNVYIGGSTGNGSAAGDGNRITLLGNSADLGADGLSNATAIGYKAKVSASNSLALGGTGADAVNVGIGNPSPIKELDIWGSLNLRSDDPTNPPGLKESSFYINYARTLSTKGTENVFVGANAGINNTGIRNTFVGSDAGGGLAISGSENVFVGDIAGLSNSSGSTNLFVGYASGVNNSVGTSNVFLGHNTGFNNTTGNTNVFIGENTGSSNVTGSSNTLVGYGANVGPGNLTNATAIGSNSVVTTSNSIVLGSNANVGIGINPALKLDVDGGIGYTAVTSTVNIGSATFNPGNFSYARISSGSAGLSVTLGDGLKTGQVLVIECTSANTFILNDNSANNMNLNSNRTLGQNDTISLVWNGSDWIELSYSNN